MMMAAPTSEQMDMHDISLRGMNSKTAGRWTQEEHALFLQGLQLYQKQWKLIAELVKTRTVVQIRTHAQKYFQKLNKSKWTKGDKNDVNNSEDDSLVNPRRSLAFNGPESRANSFSSSDGSDSITSYATTSSEGESDNDRRSKISKPFDARNKPIGVGFVNSGGLNGVSRLTLPPRMFNHSAASFGEINSSSFPKNAYPPSMPSALNNSNAIPGKAPAPSRKRSREPKSGSSPTRKQETNSSKQSKKSNATPSGNKDILPPSMVGLANMSSAALALHKSNTKSSVKGSMIKLTNPVPRMVSVVNPPLPMAANQCIPTSIESGLQDEDHDLDNCLMHILNDLHWDDSRCNSPFTDSASSVSSCVMPVADFVNVSGNAALAEYQAFLGVNEQLDYDEPIGADHCNAAPAAISNACFGSAQKSKKEDDFMGARAEPRVAFSNVIDELKMVTQVVRSEYGDADHISLFNLLQQQQQQNEDGTNQHGVTTMANDGRTAVGRLPSLKSLSKIFTKSVISLTSMSTITSELSDDRITREGLTGTSKEQNTLTPENLSSRSAIQEKDQFMQSSLLSMDPFSGDSGGLLVNSAKLSMLPSARRSMLAAAALNQTPVSTRKRGRPKKVPSNDEDTSKKEASSDVLTTSTIFEVLPVTNMAYSDETSLNSTYDNDQHYDGCDVNQQKHDISDEGNFFDLFDGDELDFA